MKVYAIIPSGGTGSRVNSVLPKQYIKFHEKELICYTLNVFQLCTLIDEIIIPARKEFFELLQSIKVKYRFTKLTKVIEGGDERQYSVFSGVRSINAKEEDLICVHDAVRPILSLEILEDAILSAKELGSAVVAINAKDTLLKGKDFAEEYINRTGLWYVQTPQVFKYKIFKDAMHKAEKENFLGTDESMLVKRAGYDVKIVQGSSLNFKITTQDDLKLFDNISHQIKF